MQTSAFRSFSKNKMHPESLHKRKYERVVSYAIDGQQLNKNMLMLNGDNCYFNPIKESLVNMSQTDSERISSLKHEFKPKVMNKIKFGEQTPFTQNNLITLEHQHLNHQQKKQQKVSKEVRYYNLKSLILPDENKYIPSITSPQLPPRKPLPINLTSSKSLNVNKPENKTKIPKAKFISSAIKRENLKYDKEGSRKLVENWLESIRPYYENKLISHDVSPPIDTNNVNVNSWSRLKQKTQQPPLPKLTTFGPNEFAYRVAMPIFETTFGVYNQIPYFNNYGYMNYFPVFYRKF